MVRRIINEEGYTKVSFPKFQKHNDRIHRLFTQQNTATLGKYLIFSSSKNDLIELGEIVCANLELSEYWVSNNSKGNGTFAYVLKIYDISDRYSRVIPSIIKKYNTIMDIEYRYWKSEKKTRAGMYSQEFRNTCDI